MNDNQGIIKQLRTLIAEIYRAICSSELKFGDKYFFLLTYIPKIIFYKASRNYKKSVKLLGGRKFRYFGDHLNLPLDHLIGHLNSYLKYYKGSKIIFDVGASFGLFSLYVKYFNPKAKIYSFEPAVKVYNFAQKNLRGIKDVSLFNVAISDRESEVLFKTDNRYPEGSRIVNYKGKNVRKTKQIRLDDFVKNNQISEISLLKIDTEGYELKVLKGAKNTLKITEKIIIETDISDNNSLIKILKLLTGFRLENFGDINRDGNKIGSIDLIFVKK